MYKPLRRRSSFWVVHGFLASPQPSGMSSTQTALQVFQLGRPQSLATIELLSDMCSSDRDNPVVAEEKR